jgi:hypothetical protein
MSAPEPSDPRPPTTCPRCGAPLHEDQDWCLECGAPARTRLAPTPNWHIPAALLAVVVALAGAALAVAFVQLTKDAPPAQATTAAPAPAEGVAPPVATTPAVTSSVATTPPTGTTTVPTTATVPPPPATVPGQTTPPTGTTPAATTTTPTPGAATGR